MSAANDRDPVRGAQFAMTLLDDEEELARIDALSPEEIARELEADGIRREDLPNVDAFLRKGSGASAVPVVDLASARARRRRRTWVISLLAAALAAILAVIAVRSAPQIEAWWHGSPKAPDHAPPIDSAPRPPAAPPTALVNAASLRADARRACAEGLLKTCEQRLDDARALDPAGEASPEVQQFRQRIETGKGPVFTGAKPPH